MKKPLLALLAAALLLFASACAPSPSVNTPEPPELPGPVEPVEPVTINFAVLSGPTGVGAAKLITDAQAGETENDYVVTIASAPDEVSGKLISGELDIAAVPSNLAAVLYNKTGGDVRCLAVCGGSVLYLLERGTEPTIITVAELSGRTVYSVGQGANPEYVLRHLLRYNGLEPGVDLTVEFKTAEEISAWMLSDEGDICMLPVPAVTALLQKADAQREESDAFQSPTVFNVVSIADDWTNSGNDGAVIMSCIVVREAFAQEHPEAVEAFLREYAASVEYTNANVSEAAQLVAELGIVGSPVIAAKAIPDCALMCVTGAEMEPLLAPYYQVLFDAEPASVGGILPDSDFYYVP